MKIVIFTFENAPQDRQDNVDVLKDELNAEVFSGGDSTCENLINMCKKYKNQNVLLIEDDVQICRDFLDYVNDVIQNEPNKIINFHYNRNVSDDRYYDTIGDLDLFELNGIEYGFNQCVYLPKKYIQKILRNTDMFIRYHAYVEANAHATVMSRIFEHDKFLVVKPSLVKHLSFESSINEGQSEETIDFIDD